ncbi:leukocyte receptor cluster member 1 homolog [Zootermopsis nevadensis]|uniref:Leukocyte receptor cluster member 1 n=1 Tax=Zootermopsis nevadensis TaxID=136037 RepID=A0A067QGG2_ZOONE|nr:leukocyte receptor cluster member 1 homolog [Zootermopsis nevadensis]KDR06888.1 Leukocyte receptor cluster member 1 [Zootermopsis nevadensis]
MNILPKKRWHVRTRENMARVRRDEERVAAEKEEQERRTQLAEGEARNAALRKKSLLRHGQVVPKSEEPQGHINLFEDLEKGEIVSNSTNTEYEKEKKDEREKYEKQIGYLTYLGQDTVEATGSVSWYNKLPDRSSPESDRKKIKLLGDPLDDIKHYLGLPEVKTNSRKNRDEEKRKCTESSTRRANKSKEKAYKHKSKKRLQRKDPSTNSGNASSSENADETESSSTKDPINLEHLRAQRLKREQEERKRSEALLARLRGEPDPESSKSDAVPSVTQCYNSQFNPHLARQNKL